MASHTSVFLTRKHRRPRTVPQLYVGKTQLSKEMRMPIRTFRLRGWGRPSKFVPALSEILTISHPKSISTFIVVISVSPVSRANSPGTMHCYARSGNLCDHRTAEGSRMRQHGANAEALLRDFAARHSFTIERINNPNLELLMRLPRQPGLSFELVLGLQNGDEVNIGFEGFGHISGRSRRSAI